MTRDIGWVFWTVALTWANQRAKETGRRWRVRHGRDGGWVAEPTNLENDGGAA